MGLKINMLHPEEAYALVLLYENGSMYRAAAEAETSYATFRRRVQRAQSKLGCELFIVENGRYVPKPGAKTIIDILKNTEKLLVNAHTEAMLLKGKDLPSTVRYCYTPLTRASSMSRNLAYLNTVCPGKLFEMVIYEGSMSERIRMRNEFGKEFEIWPGYDGETDLLAYPFCPVFEEELVLAARNSHPLSAFSRVTPKNLKGMTILAADKTVSRYYSEAAAILEKNTEGLNVRYSRIMDLNLLNKGMKYDIPVLVPESWTHMYPNTARIRICIGKQMLENSIFKTDQEKYSGRNLVPFLIPYGFRYSGDLCRL